MSNRTKYKLRRAKLSFRKNVLAEGITVKGILAVLTLGALLVICGFSITVAKENIQNDIAKAKNEAKVVEVTVSSEEDTEKEEVSSELTEQNEEEATYSIELAEVSMIDTELFSSKLEAFEDGGIDKEESKKDSLTTSLSENEFVVTADSLNIRESAGTDSDIVGHIYKGMTGEITEDSEEWVKIKSGEVEGFVKKEYISREDDTEVIDHLAEVTANNVNIRSMASQNGEILLVAAEGDVYPTLSDSKEEWSEVVLPDGTNAYIYNSYVDITEGKANAVSVKDYDAFNDKVKSYNSTKQEEEKKEEASSEEKKEDNSKTEETTDNSNKKEQTTTEKTTEKATEKATEQPTTQAPTTEATTAASTASGSDYELICAVVYAESGGEPYEGQVAVANVILNRVRSGRWGSSVTDVLYAKNQFTCVNGARFKRALGGNVPATTAQAVQAAMGGYNNIGNAMSFRPTWYLNPNSVSNSTVIGNHVFF